MAPRQDEVPRGRTGRMRRDDDCGRCGHAFARHAATLASPAEGGYPCSVFGCDCANYRAPDRGTRALLDAASAARP